MVLSGVTASSSASGRRMSLCASTGRASAFTSSAVTNGRPSAAATLATLSSAMLPRG